MQTFTQQMVDSVFSFGELGFQEFETKYLTDILEKNGFTVAARRRRHSDGVDGDVGIGQAGDRARLRHRLHPAGVAEAGRRVSRSDHRRRAGPRRRPQLRHAAEHHRGARGEEDHGARASCRARSALAGRRRGAASAPRRTSSAPGCSRTSTSRSSRTSATTSDVSLGRRRRHRPRLGRSTRSRARARTPPARRGAAAARSTPSS